MIYILFKQNRFKKKALQWTPYKHNSVRTKPTSLHIKHINPNQRIQIKFNQTIKYPILINKSPRLTYEENVALFLQNDPDISLQIT
ncbi:hypothetical protein BpHYR1_022574 [Brachionus plicatilis]|uniref:Uncharacterized protein n=1 Tax=Brachionus plicatilis TaxID=10195 RepID=A0A3M7QI74_BRAPC|nr:hypothetical protein BpHYR1_022574 [Brachionus plicatilis]